MEYSFLPLTFKHHELILLEQMYLGRKMPRFQHRIRPIGHLDREIVSSRIKEEWNCAGTKVDPFPWHHFKKQKKKRKEVKKSFQSILTKKSQPTGKIGGTMQEQAAEFIFSFLDFFSRVITTQLLNMTWRKGLTWQDQYLFCSLYIMSVMKLHYFPHIFFMIRYTVQKRIIYKDSNSKKLRPRVNGLVSNKFQCAI